MARLIKTIQHAGLREISVLASILLALPFGWKGLTGLYVWFSPFIMLNSVFALKSLVWLNLIGFVILLLSIHKKRWFCKKLCPVGWGCDLVSSYSRKPNFSLKKIPPVGMWLAVASLFGAVFGIPLFIFMDPLSVFNGFFDVFAKHITIYVILSLIGFPLLLLVHFLLPNIWCAKVCPLGGFLDGIFKIKKNVIKRFRRERKPFSGLKFDRRLFLASGLGITSGLLVPHLLKGQTKKFFKPPSAVKDGVYGFLCVRCGNCIKACPSGILEHRADIHDVMNWMVPEINFKNGYCIENCNLCSQVCPSGAIILFEKEAKSPLKIGAAEVIPQNCLLIKNKECDRCKSVCPYDAITIEEVGVFKSLPIVNNQKCNGCGACAAICPTETILMKLI